VSLHEGLIVPDLSLAIVRADLASATTVGRFEGEHLLVSQAPGGLAFERAMFGRNTLIGIDGSGYYVAFNGRYEIRRYNCDGTLTSIIRVIAPPQTISSADIEAIVDSIGRDRPAAARKYASTWRARASHYTTLPAYTAILVDAENDVWVRETALPGHASTHWTVFASSGEFRARIEIPADLRILSVDSTTVIATPLSSATSGLVSRVAIDRGYN
jgi:hypothetical protein